MRLIVKTNEIPCSNCRVSAYKQTFPFSLRGTLSEAFFEPQCGSKGNEKQRGDEESDIKCHSEPRPEPCRRTCPESKRRSSEESKISRYARNDKKKNIYNDAMTVGTL